VKSLVGHQAKILSIKISDVILPDDSLLIDVEYQEMPFGMMTIYFIESSTLKSVIPNSPLFGVNVLGIPVRVTLKQPDVQKYLPIRINKRVDFKDEDHRFLYFGTPVKTPLLSYCSILKRMYKNFTCEEIEQLYPQKFQPKSEITEEKMLSSYKMKIKQVPQLNFVIDIIPARSLDKLENQFTKGFLIDWHLIDTTKKLNGIIYIQPERTPFKVVFIPSATFTIDIDELLSIDEFLQMENVNYLNFHYKMGEK
jgi:hypothetical protein